MINAKRKGTNGELAFASWLRENGIKAYRDSASGGGNASKSDINSSIDCTIEIKTVKKINLHEVWKKLSINASNAQRHKRRTNKT